MSELENLKQEYRQREEEISKRQEQWKQRGKSNPREMFKYLSKNLLSPKANWDVVERVVEDLDRDGRLWTLSATEMSGVLFELGYTFGDGRDRFRKSDWVCKARERFFGSNKQEDILDWVARLRSDCEKDPLETRNKMADRNQPTYHLDGLGPKVSSHLLRGLGLSDNKLAILDYWVLYWLVRFGVITEEEGKANKLSNERYLCVEEKMKNWAQNEPGIPPLDVLDLLMWRRKRV